MSVAINIVDIALESARQNNAKKINRIVLDLGALAGILRESLEFCYSSACKGTIAEGSELQVNTIPAKAFCPACQLSFESEQPVINCPGCGEVVFKLEGGHQLRIASINID